MNHTTVSIGGQSSIFSGDRLPVSQTLMSTNACRSRLPSLIPPGSRSSVSRNIPAEVKGVKYNGDVEWGPFYSKFSTMAEYHQWSEPDCLFARSLTLEGTARSLTLEWTALRYSTFCDAKAHR